MNKTATEPVWWEDELARNGSNIEHFSLPMSGALFDYFREIAHTHAGIVIADYKKAMVCRRVAKRLRALDIDSFEDYRAFLEGPCGERELEPLINALTTNKTEFFREDHHFVHLANTVLPRVIRRAKETGQRRLRIWSAGCSTGQEPYTIAMTVAEALRGQGAWNAKILATDIDTEVLAIAKAAIYGPDDLVTLPPAYAKTYTHAVPGRGGDRQIDGALRQLVTFKPLNLHGGWPIKGPFDAIFCRNVIIYFDRPHQKILFDRFAALLPTGGVLYCGHSESLVGITTRFRPSGRSIYEKIT